VFIPYLLTSYILLVQCVASGFTLESVKAATSHLDAEHTPPGPDGSAFCLGNSKYILLPPTPILIVTTNFERSYFCLVRGNSKNEMGKGGDASAATIRGPMKLVGDKSEKYTWAEVKKHVSLFVLSARSNTPLSCSRMLAKRISHPLHVSMCL
jgi:hypothetical protein